MKKIRIAFLVTDFPKLSETFVLNQITGLIERGHEVDIYAYEPSLDTKSHEDVAKYDLLSRTIYYGDSIRKIPPNRILRFYQGFALLMANFDKNPQALLKSLNMFKFKRQAVALRTLYQIAPFMGKGDYDVVHCHFGPNGILGVYLKDLGVFTGKVITVFHGYDISQYIMQHGRDVYKYLFENGDLFLPISNRWKDELIALGCREDKIMVHHMGIATERYDYTQRNTGGGTKIRILSIGRFVEKKGIRYGVEAVGSIVKEYPDIEYTIIGDGPLRDEIESIIDKMNLRETIRLLGWKSQEEILNVLKDSDILLAPSVTSKESDQEGIPVVLMEAMAMGLPVISTYHSGIPELVQDGVSGFLAPEGNVTILTDKLRQCIEDRGLWPSIGNEGRKMIIREYNINNLNDRLVGMYQQLINSRECYG